MREGIKERVAPECIIQISVGSKISNPTFFVPKYVIVKSDVNRVMLPGLLLLPATYKPFFYRFPFIIRTLPFCGSSWSIIVKSSPPIILYITQVSLI